MQVSKIENPAGNLIRLEFSRASDEDFKTALMEWIQANYPDWGYPGFFQRLATFQAGNCSINMHE